MGNVMDCSLVPNVIALSHSTHQTTAETAQKKHNNVNRHNKLLELSFSAIAIFVNDSCYQDYILASIVIVYLTL